MLLIMFKIALALTSLAWVGQGIRAQQTFDRIQGLQSRKALARLLQARADLAAAWQVAGHGRMPNTSVSHRIGDRFAFLVAPQVRMSDKASLIDQTDHLHEKNKVDEYFNLLAAADASDSDLAWRMARAYHDKAEETVDDKAERERLLREGLSIAEAAREKFGDGYSTKWYAIVLGRLGDFLPTKEKVANSYKIKEALEAAATQLPKDRTIQTALGQWCYKVAGISWVERNAAKLLFGKPPTSSYEEALKYMLASWELSPSKKASLYAGLCYKELKKSAEANEWFQKCLDLESSGEADAEIDKQAKANMK